MLGRTSEGRTHDVIFFGVFVVEGKNGRGVRAFAKASGGYGGDALEMPHVGVRRASRERGKAHLCAQKSLYVSRVYGATGRSVA